MTENKINLRQLAAILVILLIIIVPIILYAIKNQKYQVSSVNNSSSMDEHTEGNGIERADHKPDCNCIGVFRGIQPAYLMTGSDGVPIEVYNHTVEVPSSTYEFEFKPKGQAILRQTAINDPSRHGDYSGIYIISKKMDNQCIIVAELESADHLSKPTFYLLLDADVNSAKCSGKGVVNGPEFTINKVIY